MPQRSLLNRRVLVVEDEYMLADELCAELGGAGVIVVGPAATVRKALDLIDSEDIIDGAVLDMNLRGESAIPVADLLVARGVPLVFTTGYDASAIPARFADVIRCEKPADPVGVARAIERAIRR